MTIREQISEYLIKHPIDRDQKSPYDVVAKKFGVDSEVVRCQWRKLRNKGLVEEGEAKLFIQKSAAPSYEQDSTFKRKGNEATLSKSLSKEVRNEKELAEECGIDLEKWEIKEWECKRYNAWIKNKEGEIESQPKYSVWAKMKLRTVEEDLELQKEVIIEELKKYAPKVTASFEKENIGECLLEIAIPDLHLGSLAWHEETGDNYDIKIAEKRFKDAISKLLSRVDIKNIGKIMLPVGNDFLNVDNKNNSTSNGTVVDTDCRFMKMVKAAKRILIETIDNLSFIAPVDVVIVPGNHDYTSSLMLGEILGAFYHDNQRVTIDNGVRARKYYKFGKVGIQMSHGDEEKHADLGLIFATEEPKLWANTEFRYCQLGHHHKNKKISYLSVDEFQGFQVQILPTLSSLTAWAYKKGYSSLKQAKAFKWHPIEGLVAEYTYTA